MDWTRAVMLAGALALVGVAALIPHGSLPGDDWSPLPVHMDEYLHWGWARAAAEQRTLNPSNPFSGDPPDSDTGRLKERGFHAYAAAFQQISGLPWETILLWGPALVALATALAAYVLAQRWDGGVAAVVLLAAVPTTVRFLGPGFFVPIAFSLPVVVLGADALFRARDGSAIPFLVLAMAAWTVHPMAGAMVVSLAVIYGAVSWFDVGWRVRVTILLALVAFAVAWPVYAHYIAAGLYPTPLPPAMEQFQSALAVLLLAGAGAACAGSLPTPAARGAAYALALLALGLEIVQLVRIAAGRDAFILYDRSFLVAHVLAALLGSIGVAFFARRVRAWAARGWRVAALCALVALLVAPAFAVASSWSWQDENGTHYTMMTERQRAGYADAAAKLDRRAPRAIVDGLPTMAFSDVTGVPTTWVWGPSDAGPDPRIDAFFEKGASDTSFILKRHATLVVTKREVENPDLVRIADGVYQLRPELLDKVVAARKA